MSINDDILFKIDSEIDKDKKVVELRKEIEELINSNNFWKRKCSEMGIALKTYEEGRYQEHLENEQLHSIIREVREYIENKEFINYKKNLGNFERMLKHRQDISKILDKVEE